jgi:hypothetical protein
MIDDPKPHDALPQRRGVTILGFMRAKWWVAVAIVFLVFAYTQIMHVGVNRDSVIDLVYLGGPDCPYCRKWEASELPRLREMPDYRHIRFTHVPKVINSPVPDKTRLPSHLAPMYDEMIRQTRGRSGSPQFVLLVDGRAVDGGFGTPAYHRLLPTMSELVARKLGG